MTNVLQSRIRTLRKSAHITQEDMALHLGISRRTYANYERGVHAMPVEIFICIADMFHVTLDDLAGRNAPPELPESRGNYDGTVPNRDYYGEN